MFFDRYTGGEKSLLVHPEGLQASEREDAQEFYELAVSSGVTVLDTVMVSGVKITPRYFLTSGKVEEIKQQVLSSGVELVLFNHALSPGQERNLEAAFQCRVVDRIGLILDIFAQRARTHEGKLQVELAQLQHLSTRLVRGWTHLERQKGGVGLRGPGETQLETDRRLLRIRVKSITKKLDKVRKQRDQTRRSRQRAEIPQVSIVGYTNAGKSTLFNSITSSEVYVADQLFATLDPTLRCLQLPDIGSVILADTVGFIRHLPHRLIESFRATLEELTSSELLLHLVDCASDDKDDNIEQVCHVLSEIDAAGIPQLLVYNKIDLLADTGARIDRDENGMPYRVWVSVLSGEGMDLLVQAITERLSRNIVHRYLMLDYTHGSLRAMFYEMGAVLSESAEESGKLCLEVRMPEDKLQRLLKNNDGVVICCKSQNSC